MKDRPKINVNYYTLQTHCSKLWNYRAKGILIHHKSAIHRLGGYYYMILSILKVLSKALSWKQQYNVSPAKHLRFICGQSNVRVRIQKGFCRLSAYGFKKSCSLRQEMNSGNIFMIIISTNIKVTIIISIYFHFDLYFKRIFV